MLIWITKWLDWMCVVFLNEKAISLILQYGILKKLVTFIWLIFKVWSFIKSFHYYKKQLLKKRLSKTSSSSVTKQEQCAHYLIFNMTTFNIFTGTIHINININPKRRFNGKYIFLPPTLLFHEIMWGPGLVLIRTECLGSALFTMISILKQLYCSHHFIQFSVFKLSFTLAAWS